MHIYVFGLILNCMCAGLSYGSAANESRRSRIVLYSSLGSIQTLTAAFYAYLIFEGSK